MNDLLLNNKPVVSVLNLNFTLAFPTENHSYALLYQLSNSKYYQATIWRAISVIHFYSLTHYALSTKLEYNSFYHLTGPLPKARTKELGKNVLTIFKNIIKMIKFIFNKLTIIF